MKKSVEFSQDYFAKKKLIGDTINIYFWITITELYFKVASAFTTKY